MAFLETRGMLAKLLACENIVVEHDHTAKTAAFDTLNRVLKLPVFKVENENVYNMLVGHEVGHALQTPTNWRDDLPDGVPSDFVNVIEDVRIEKYIQSKFPGLRVDFTKGYDELNAQDFFAIRDTDLSELSFIDRINLHFKLGVRALIPFTSEELTYVNAVDDCDTWDKVILVSKMLSDYINQKSESNDTDTEELTGNSDSDGEQEETTNTTNQSSSDKSDDTDDEEGDSDSDVDLDTESPNANESVSQTQRSFDESMDKMQDSVNSMDQMVYVSMNDVNLDKYITDIKTLRESYIPVEPNWVYDKVLTGYEQFIKSIRGDVNHMVQQFEMKKSADAYARQQVNKTGVLDTNLLHAYKLTDDVFLRQNVTPDGKNHGMVMYLDWSGSMSDICIETVKQIITLVQFCRKIQIPFDVYTFTTSGPDSYEERDLSLNKTPFHEAVNLIQVLSSNGKKKEIDQDIQNLYVTAHVIHSQSSYLPMSPYMHMGGTPLNNALLLVPELIKRFRKKTGAQKVSFVCVTDGESSPVQFYETRKTYDGDSFVRPSYVYYEKVMIRSGMNVYPVSCDDRGTPDIVRWLKSQVDDVSITHLYLAGLSSCSRYLRSITRFDEKLDEKVFRKEGCVTSKTDSWPLVGLINPRSFTDSEDDIQVESGASKTQIKSALKKYLKSKTSSRLVLTQLVGQFS